MRLIAAWASVKTVTRSGVVRRGVALRQFPVPWKGGTLFIVGLLVVVHVDLETLPALTILPCDQVASSSAVKP
jgi:hypothetical protein